MLELCYRFPAVEIAADAVGIEIVVSQLEAVDTPTILSGAAEVLMTKLPKPVLGVGGTAEGDDGGGLTAFHEFRFILLFFRMLTWYAARMALVASLATLLPLPALDGR